MVPEGGDTDKTETDRQTDRQRETDRRIDRGWYQRGGGRYRQNRDRQTDRQKQIEEYLATFRDIEWNVTAKQSYTRERFEIGVPIYALKLKLTDLGTFRDT